MRILWQGVVHRKYHDNHQLGCKFQGLGCELPHQNTQMASFWWHGKKSRVQFTPRKGPARINAYSEMWSFSEMLCRFALSLQLHVRKKNTPVYTLKLTINDIQIFVKFRSFAYSRFTMKYFILYTHHLTHWGQVAHICVSRLTIIGSDNGLSPGRRQAIIWTNTGILLNRPLGTKFNEMLIEILTFPFKKMRLKVSSAKWRPCCLGLNVLTYALVHNWGCCHSRCQSHQDLRADQVRSSSGALHLRVRRGLHQVQARRR